MRFGKSNPFSIPSTRINGEGKAQATISQELKANPYRVKLNMQKAMRFSSEALLYNLSLLADFDQQMKMGKIDKDDGFEYFCLNLMMNKG